MSDIIPFETARETYGAYHTSTATSANIVVVVPVPIFHPAALNAIFMNSARVRLLSGLNFSPLFIIHRATRRVMYAFAQLLAISVNRISLSDLITKPGIVKVIVDTPLVVVVVTTTPFFVFSSVVVPLAVTIVTTVVVLHVLVVHVLVTHVPVVAKHLPSKRLPDVSPAGQLSALTPQPHPPPHHPPPHEEGGTIQLFPEREKPELQVIAHV